MKRILYILMLLSLHAHAQDQLTLQEAIEEGLKNNYSIIIEDNNAVIAHNNATVGNAGMLPVADAIVTQTNTINDTKQKYSTGAEVDRTNATAHTLNAGAALSWTIFDGFTMFAAYNRLKELDAS